jgi:hypothetical protein
MNKRLVGLTIDEAEEKYPGILICAYKIDGEYQMVWSNYCSNRYNVAIKKGKITGYIFKE